MIIFISELVKFVNAYPQKTDKQKNKARALKVAVKRFRSSTASDVVDYMQLDSYLDEKRKKFLKDKTISRAAACFYASNFRRVCKDYAAHLSSKGRTEFFKCGDAAISVVTYGEIWSQKEAKKVGKEITAYLAAYSSSDFDEV